jgi:hypothetical protein
MIRPLRRIHRVVAAAFWILLPVVALALAFRVGAP